MKTITKVSIGLSIVAGVSVTVIASGKILKRMNHLGNRCKAKKFVRETFNGNKKLLEIVDDLSDKELDSVVSILTKVKDGKEKLSSYEDTIKNKSENFKERLFKIIEEII